MSERKTLLVSGGSHGIGAAVARLSAAAGYDVILTYLHNQAAAEAVATELRGRKVEASAIRCDVGVEDDVARLFAEIDRRGLRLDALVNNAGIGGANSTLADAELSTIRRILDVNLYGTIMLAREAVRRMSTARGGKGGAIVNVSSVAATLGSAGDQIWYAASKGGVDSFTIGLAREVAREGIRVNAVAPGPVDTGETAPREHHERLAKIIPTMPIGRIGKPQEIAEAVVWLLSGAASYVTGAILRVSGGR